MLNNKLLLASASPRRQQMIGWLGIPFRVLPASVDETSLNGESPEGYVCRLARQKAMCGHEQASEDENILAADTIVVDGSDLLGKPAGSQDAREMLYRLRGRIHTVYTAICIYNSQNQTYYADMCTSSVPMRNYSDTEIENYIASGDPLDKAGAYAIQSPMFHPVENFTDCYASVMGLPLCHLVRTLTRFTAVDGINPPDLCKMHMGYSCTIYDEILHPKE